MKSVKNGKNNLTFFATMVTPGSVTMHTTIYKLVMRQGVSTGYFYVTCIMGDLIKGTCFLTTLMTLYSLNYSLN